MPDACNSTARSEGDTDNETPEEINLVSRLAKAMPDRTIFCLDPQVCPCSTMYRIHPSFLLWALENLAEGRVVNEVAVPSEVRANARLALDRMLDVSAQPVAD